MTQKTKSSPWLALAAVILTVGALAVGLSLLLVSAFAHNPVTAPWRGVSITDLAQAIEIYEDQGPEAGLRAPGGT